MSRVSRAGLTFDEHRVWVALIAGRCWHQITPRGELRLQRLDGRMRRANRRARMSLPLSVRRRYFEKR